MFKNLRFTKSNEKLTLENIKDGAVIIFSTHPESNFSKKQLKNFEDKQKYFNSKNVSVFFLTDTPDKSNSNIYLTDLDGEIQDLVPSLSSSVEFIGENLIIFIKTGDDLVFSEVKKMPENDYNWSETMSDWAENFNDSVIGDDDMWKWGQICPKTADYLCVDCGYVEEIQKGQTFPICIVCLSGEVDGPSGPTQEYWQEI